VINELLNANRAAIVTSALSARVATTFGTRWTKAGGLMSYGPNFPDLFRRAAGMADRILRGTKLKEIPVEQPTRFELVVNLKTPNAFGITVQPVSPFNCAQSFLAFDCPIGCCDVAVKA
jgi:putative ABC transport system substrate-binding protein